MPWALIPPDVEIVIETPDFKYINVPGFIVNDSVIVKDVSIKYILLEVHKLLESVIELILIVPIL